MHFDQNNKAKFFIFFVLKNAQCSEANAEPTFTFFKFENEQLFYLKKIPPSQPDNQLARGIQSKSIRCLGAEHPAVSVGDEAPLGFGGIGGRSPPNISLFAPILLKFFFATLHEPIFDKKLFIAKLFFIFLESSETQFDLVASKIGAKLNNLVIK